MKSILLVEDNKSLSDALTYLLTQSSFEVKSVSNIKDATKEISKKYDLIILDISLPDGSGFNLFLSIKEINDAPIIFLTAKDSEEDVVKGLELGCDDYIIKPFRNRELIARINKILERTDKNIIKVKNVLIELDTNQVFVDKSEVEVTALELKIIILLFKRAGSIVTREVILNNIWDLSGKYVEDNTLTVYIKRIREKLKSESIITTIKGIGYRVNK
ncbi:MAG: response regulator transcription factor [Bacilli bacterium]